jgi:hypothetical protein
MSRRFLAVAVVVASCSAPPAAKQPVAPPVPDVTPPEPAETGLALDRLTEGAHVHGFTAVALYLDDTDQPIGARFIHDKTKFTFDYLQIESAPQGYLWVHSFPTSDKGEPHTQEHLLLLKGDRGRRLGSMEVMALAESSAFTAQWHTAYNFHTVAGSAVFWPVFENQIDSMLNPDYTDEEIRREVRNFGVEKGDDGKLHLDEKGTVYNEMVRTYEQPDVGASRRLGQMLYGDKHPLALESGGLPAAIRTISAQDIRTFHDANYHLANMGMVAAFPRVMPLASVLDQTGAILEKEMGRTGKVTTDAELPPPVPAAKGATEVVDYPYSDTANPSPMVFAWGATRSLDDGDLVLLSLFMSALAGDESTTLYKKLIDSKTRVVDLGASALWSSVSTEQGQPVYFGLAGVKADRLDAKTLGDVRAIVLAELERIGKLPAGNPELVALDARMASRVIDLKRRTVKFLDTPPGFGERGTGSDWFDHLHRLAKIPGFKKSLTLHESIGKAEKAIAEHGNPWRDRIKAWGLLDAPYAIAARPSPTMRKELDAEYAQRVAAETARLQQKYATKDAPATLARYQQDYDAETAKIDEAAKSAQLPPLVATPPMTLDDGLAYSTDPIAGLPAVRATFDTMASARVTVAFDVRSVLPPADLMYLAGLPGLLSDVGVLDGKTPIPADEVAERLRKEVLDLDVRFSSNPATGRIELVVAGAGNNPAETRNALAWMGRIIHMPDWRIENLPRIRDVVAHQIAAQRARPLGAEEAWVRDPANAWWRGTDAVYLHTSSFLTRAYDLHRLRWMLADPRDARVSAEVVKFFALLGTAKALPRPQLVELTRALASGTASKTAAKWTTAAHALSDKGQALARDAGKDLGELLADLPDRSLAGDWAALCTEMSADLQLGAEAALAKLERARYQIFQGPNARIVEVGSTAHLRDISGAFGELLKVMPTPQKREGFGQTSPTNLIAKRLLDRDPKATAPKLVGLFNSATSSGVFINMAPSRAYLDPTDDTTLDYLTGNLYAGHGGHTIYSKTVAAGLAYSNGLRPDPAAGELVYYAERCPLLPQTLRFVIAQLKAAKTDPNLARYAIAYAFDSRIAKSYEERAEAMAANLVDGITPELVRAFRKRLLALSGRGDLADELFKRMPAVYGKVLPGYGALDPKGVYFVIGPDKQLGAYQDYLHTALGKDTTLFRLYPRDFWQP